MPLLRSELDRKENVFRKLGLERGVLSVVRSSEARSANDEWIGIGSASVKGASEGGGMDDCGWEDCVERVLGGWLSDNSVIPNTALSACVDLCR